MSEWKKYSFADFVEINPVVKLKTGDEISFVEMKDLDATKKFVSPSAKRKLTGGSRFQNNDTLFARITPCLENGKICQVKNLENEVGFGSTEFLVFRGKKDISSTEFVYYLSRWNEVRSFAVQNMIGTSGRQRVGKEAFKNFELEFPDFKTQNKIASILSSLDEMIELNQQTNKILEEIPKTIFKEWFVDFNFPNANEKMQQTEIGEIPTEWKVETFENVFDADRGLSYKGAGLAESDAMPMHNLNSVFEGGGYKTNGIKYYNGDYKDKHIVKAGELIVANTEQGHKYMLIGYPAIIPRFYGEQGIFSHHIYRLKPKKDCWLSPDFIYHLLLQPQVRNQVIGFANGTTVNMLKIEGLHKPKFAMPPKELAEKFTAIAKANRLQAEQNIEENQALSDLRDTLLPKLMKGEINLEPNFAKI